MYKKIFNLFLLMSIFSCESGLDIKLDSRQESNEHVVETGIVADISNYIKSSRLGGIKTRSTINYKLQPFLCNGDTVMYIVNYENGWDIFSNDYRVPMILFSSETGNLDLNDESVASTLKGLIRETADGLYEVGHSEEYRDTIVGLWETVKLRNQDVDKDKVIYSPKTRSTRKPGDNGYWELLERTTELTGSTSTPKLTNTAWNQSSPWNTKIPYKKANNTKQDPAGCGPVAVAQYLYYNHYDSGVPVNTVTTSVYDSTYNTYSYYGSSSSVWDLMALNSSSSKLATDYVATFIGYLGKCMDTEYEDEKASTTLSSIKSIVNDQLGTGYSWEDLDNVYVRNQLASNKIVLTIASVKNRAGEIESSHCFIIDRRGSRTYKTICTYGWVGEDDEGNDTNDRDEDGNIVGYSFFYEKNSTTTSPYFMMNWGWGGYYDNVVCYELSDWEVGSYNFNANKKILK